MFPKLISAEPLANYRLQLRFDDGTTGEIDLSHLAGKGLFAFWDEGNNFFLVHIDPETNALVWNDMLDIDPDNLYLQLKGLSFEQFQSLSNPNAAYASN